MAHHNLTHCMDYAFISCINGARTFSKFSSFDLAITIAVGSVLSRALVASDQAVAHTVVAVLDDEEHLYQIRFRLQYSPNPLGLPPAVLTQKNRTKSRGLEIRSKTCLFSKL